MCARHVEDELVRLIGEARVAAKTSVDLRVMHGSYQFSVVSFQFCILRAFQSSRALDVLRWNLQTRENLKLPAGSISQSREDLGRGHRQAAAVLEFDQQLAGQDLLGQHPALALGGHDARPDAAAARFWNSS